MSDKTQQKAHEPQSASQQKTCTYCNNPATHEAPSGGITIRSCDRESCKKRAERDIEMANR